MEAKRPIPSDLELARGAKMLPIERIAKKLGIDEKWIELYGKTKAKVSLEFYHRIQDRPLGRLILVTAMTPTPAGEGKTTTTVGLGDALNRIGKEAVICLREPSMGPCFGFKGGAAGGGYAQVVPMEEINLHFTGDFHAVASAHNLLAAVIDNHLHQGNRLQLDSRRIVWKRVLDVNDRALRDMVVGLGGTGNSVPRETGFDITAASEVMAILCLSESLAELRERLGKIVVGYTTDRKPVLARDLGVHGAMAVLLKNALQPNLVQTIENNPALIHGGPFANIAHGCNSVIATKLAMRLAPYTVTEAGFGADLGAEKFFDIKCRKAGLKPSAAVLVATLRALKYHGGMELADVTKPNSAALEKGLENLKKHVENLRRFGVPVLVAVNRFSSDTDDEIRLVQEKCGHLGVEVVRTDHWEKGGRGAEDLARAVISLAEGTAGDFQFLYKDDSTLWEKTEMIAREIYGAIEILADKKLRAKFKSLQESGYGRLPVCMAKTQYSLSTDPGLRGRPRKFDVPLQDIRLSAGAEFVVVLAGDIMTMPGLPQMPSAENIDLDNDGNTVGLF